MEVKTLIQEMKDCKQENPIIEIQDILRIFQIKAMQDLTNQIRRGVNNGL